VPAPLAPVPGHPRRLVYLGTPEVAVGPLHALHAGGFDLALVVSGPDKRRGRGSALEPSPVKAAALELGLPVSSVAEDACDVGADLGVVVAFGHLIRRPVLEVLPMVNIHFSLLPRWRGAAPVERAILAGDATTGVCLMQVVEELDAGPVFARVETGIGDDESLDELRSRLVALGADLLVSTLSGGLEAPVAQVGEPTYARKLATDDLHLDWSRPARELLPVVRLGGAWTEHRGRRLKVWKARLPEPAPEPAAAPAVRPGVVEGVLVATGDGVLELIEVQPEGKARQSARSWVNGARPTPGERLGP
jgi:methionyl-tRNA formyltransferase